MKQLSHFSEIIVIFAASFLTDTGGEIIETTTTVSPLHAKNFNEQRIETESVVPPKLGTIEPSLNQNIGESESNQTGKLRCQAENAKITELEGTVNAKNKLISYLETKCRIREESQNQKDDEFRKMFDFSVWT